MSVLHRHAATAETEFSLLMLGLPGAAWHLELTHPVRHTLRPAPMQDDLLVLYLGEPVSEAALGRLQECGGGRVPALNPYWDEWGVTVRDPDGYRLVLCAREWTV